MTDTLVKQASIDNQQFKKLLRAWGWTQTDGGDHVNFRRDGQETIIVGMSGSVHPELWLVEAAAKASSVTVHQWLKGPGVKVRREKKDVISDDDLTFFINIGHDIMRANKEALERYHSVRSQLHEQGLLKDYMKVRDKAQKAGPSVEMRVKEPAVEPSQPTHKPITPLPIQPDDEGYFTLADVMSVRGLKITKLSSTSCEILAALSEGGDAEDVRGAAIRRVWERIPAGNKEKPIGLTALSTMVKGWETAGIIWRDINGKRCYKIGLTIPIKLTQEERERFLLRQFEKVAVKSDIETPEVSDATVAPVITEAPEVDVPVESEPPTSYGAAIETLKIQVALLEDQIKDLTEKKKSLTLAITVLEGDEE